MLNEALDLEAVSAGRLKLHMTRCSIIEELHDITGFLAPQAAARGVALTFSWSVSADVPGAWASTPSAGGAANGGNSNADSPRQQRRLLTTAAAPAAPASVKFSDAGPAPAPDTPGVELVGLSIIPAGPPGTSHIAVVPSPRVAAAPAISPSVASRGEKGASAALSLAAAADDRNVSTAIPTILVPAQAPLVGRLAVTPRSGGLSATRETSLVAAYESATGFPPAPAADAALVAAEELPDVVLPQIMAQVAVFRIRSIVTNLLR